jgi:23S rRNA pseudouridine1911/1915/1917 synthase
MKSYISQSVGGTAWSIGPDAVNLRLDKYLADPTRLGSRARAVFALERGKVFLNGTEATLADAGKRLALGDAVRVWMDRPGSARRRVTAIGEERDLPIVYEDDALIVLNKPAGLLAVPLPRRAEALSVFDELEDYLAKQPNRRRPLIVHRIDRDTSGLVVFAKSSHAQERLRAQFMRHRAERIYLAVVYGHPRPPAGTWRDHLVWDEGALIQKETHPRDPRAKEAVCHYKVIEVLTGTSLIEVTLVTGRRNQIRLQARLRGHTLVGEQRYIYGPDKLRPISFPRQALHAFRLAFHHPTDNRELRFEAPLPEDLEALVKRLRTRD